MEVEGAWFLNGSTAGKSEISGSLRASYTLAGIYLGQSLIENVLR